MPETIAPESDDAADPDLEADAEVAETPDEDDEQEFFIPAPGGLRGL